MASEPDDNPFARNSVWPKMPQAPFRVGPLPKAGPATPVAEEPPAAAPEPPRTITPLFVRPVEPRPAPNLAMGGAAPGVTLQPAPAPVPSPAPTPASVEVRVEPPPAPPAPPVIAEPPPAEPEPVELAEIVVSPFRPAAPRPKLRRRRPPFAAVAAAVVGVAGLAGLAWLFTRGGAILPKPAAAPVMAAAPLAPTPASPVAAMLSPAPAPVTATPAAPGRLPAAPRAAAASTEVRRLSLPSDAARATEEANTTPVLSLPAAAPPPPPPPAPELERTFRPPPAADPAAPIRTQRPY